MTPLYEALLDRARRNPGGEAMRSAIEMAGKVPDTWPLLIAALGQIPEADAPTKLPLELAIVGKGRPDVEALLDRWEKSTTPALRKAVQAVRKSGG